MFSACLAWLNARLCKGSYMPTSLLKLWLIELGSAPQADTLVVPAYITSVSATRLSCSVVKPVMLAHFAVANSFPKQKVLLRIR